MEVGAREQVVNSCSRDEEAGEEKRTGHDDEKPGTAGFGVLR
jgi:hypothetical protein